ncbi:dihydroxyacetone phosphate acyltransferase-like isoform X1 [Lingula anatina]|uniref:Dihydroxyacetone phosphate acyltransferase-like isoform X1 n=1 Tax=Lingula anatina TaxID=7574 RepID=A0A1S3IJM9_LINAN|nr:dihydroxyacetone phosphate acyltransferase-like isoform X1 [Lingula anatina]|eukprot:XP_013398318.1 dihydroxyacetone phosphate acyltransferase-like isoform X1 [Lingula anatina]
MILKKTVTKISAKLFLVNTISKMTFCTSYKLRINDPHKLPPFPVFKDGYEDILEDRRGNSDLRFAIRSREVPAYKYNHPRTSAQIKEYVRKSDRVTFTIEQVASETGMPKAEVEKEANAILDEMAHNLRMGAIRGIATVLPKVMKKMYNRVYVNKEGISRVQHLIKEYPVILMPSHRSYADFLLMSYVFYHYDLPLPVIAAAMDFMGMNFVGWLLRNSGAFYIRRTFGTDKLYWSVFTEYVQTHITNGDAPVEFFVEGTRSRTGKSLVPKLGMMKACLEPYFKAHVPDIMVLPISISYDRTLEESLYSYELLGVPKPKESTSGLLKASSILNEDFGNIHMYIGEPISIRQFSIGKIDRVQHSLAPRYIASLTSDEEKLMKELAYQVVLEQQKHMVISPWALVATVLIQNKDGIDLQQLVKEVEWLKRQTANLGGYVDWPGNEKPEMVIRARLELHKHILDISDEDFVELKNIKPPPNVTPELRRDGVISQAALQVLLSLYRNQLLYLFVRPAMVTLAVNGCLQETMSMDELFKRYEFLEHLFRHEFVFKPGQTKEDFDKALLNLTHGGGLVIVDNQVQIKKSTNKYTTFLSLMFEPFLLAYWVLCKHLLSLGCDVNGKPLPKKPKVVCKEAQQLAVRWLQEGSLKHYEVMNLDILGNGLLSMIHMGAVAKDKRSGETYVSPNQVTVSSISEQIGRYIELPVVPDPRFNSTPNFSSQSKDKVTVPAKL